jgi:hypothetical protein
VGEPSQPVQAVPPDPAQSPRQSPRLWVWLAAILLLLTIAALIDRP